MTKRKGSALLTNMFERIFNSKGSLEQQVSGVDELYRLVTGKGDYWGYRRYLHEEVRKMKL